ncbi:hypothetical protein rosag_48040 [Roseisolibacter agri]|uniref:histidine kinase n=1 Tax=Roseisolibacter agri TaxID=2014610 RepID=A0AA37QEE8_9BACT|nr:hypothetical protein rosag_48040 [Roseisolibacter agri]
MRLTVADTGRGTAPDQMERGFEPFVPVDARLTRTNEGTGLGLAISRDPARAMGGDLSATSATSAPGKHSPFSLPSRWSPPQSRGGVRSASGSAPRRNGRRWCRAASCLDAHP